MKYSSFVRKIVAGVGARIAPAPLGAAFLILLLWIKVPGIPLPAFAAQHHHPVTDENDAADQLQKRALKLNSQQRQQEIRRDTEKLVQLAAELKASVDKSNENVLSLEVVKKAEQIEKLARSVKEKMKEN